MEHRPAGDSAPDSPAPVTPAARAYRGGPGRRRRRHRLRGPALGRPQPVRRRRHDPQFRGRRRRRRRRLPRGAGRPRSRRRRRGRGGGLAGHRPGLCADPGPARRRRRRRRRPALPDKQADMALVTLKAPDGRTAMPVFTSAASLTGLAPRGPARSPSTRPARRSPRSLRARNCSCWTPAPTVPSWCAGRRSGPSPSSGTGRRRTPIRELARRLGESRGWLSGGPPC